MKRLTFQTDVLPLKNVLFRLALRITQNRADAEDVVQETMMRAWARREQWQQLESIEAFCMTICRNLSLDRARRMENRLAAEAPPPADVQDHSYAANPEEQAVQRDRVELVRQLISRLPEKQRTAMQLRDVEGKSYRDIAAVMGVSEEQVKVSIFRARQTIKKEFRQHEQYGL